MRIKENSSYAVGGSRTRYEGSRVSVRASEDIICTRLEAQREETKGPHSSLSESLFQNSVTGKYSRFLLFLLF
ncbi:hypothetical protein LXL04_020577 [Taraxacum kok-saghyz]